MSYARMLVWPGDELGPALGQHDVLSAVGRVQRQADRGRPPPIPGFDGPGHAEDQHHRIMPSWWRAVNNGVMGVRRARLEDAARIAVIHVRSWQTAGQEMMPQVFLDGLGSWTGAM